ncbi:MAG: hypothetical protein NC121_00540 [Blautia sp.]|nr:hypothetical protein [Blautia sp.]
MVKSFFAEGQPAMGSRCSYSRGTGRWRAALKTIDELLGYIFVTVEEILFD